MDNRPVSFPHRKDALARSELMVAIQALYRRAILSFLRQGKEQPAPAMAALLARYRADRSFPSDHRTRAALRWFYRAARQYPPDSNVRAVQDLLGPASAESTQMSTQEVTPSGSAARRPIVT